ncbi:MAG: LysR family transcriptional regulator [Verrucomicrobiales bacterium]|nr:LysR family transcriptional regulator [Verrucomicrobiales bacterium]
MIGNPAAVTPDQAAALVELARTGSIRAAAESLSLTEQGTRNRLLSLEEQLGVSLYQKGRGRRAKTQLTRHGRMFLPAAREFCQRADELSNFFSGSTGGEVIHVAASAYLTFYVLIDIVQKFHDRFPDFRVCLSTRPEEDIETALLEHRSVSIGIAAPYHSTNALTYTHQFAMDWSLITPPDHLLLQKKSPVRLANLTDFPLILFEPGSTGREHILEAFQSRSLSPRVEMEATSTQIITRMVESGLGISIVPLLKNGVVTKGRDIGVRSLGKQVRPIHSGILIRENDALTAAETTFIDFVKQEMPV